MPTTLRAAPVMPETLTLDDLYAHFADHADRPGTEPVKAADVPEPYHGLLVHAHHMTVTVERHYGDAVDVRVIDSVQTESTYARKILLTLRRTGRIVQFGIVQIELGFLSPVVRREIVEEKTPLGRVLIRHNVLRTVRPVGFLRAAPGPVMGGWFGSAEPTYGRLGVIYTDHAPAIRVAEILAPVA